MAHIGILKAIDSAGLSIDYLTGTSMGSIIGSLYASGYSADSILYIARHMHWDQMLSNQSSLRDIIMEEKEHLNEMIDGLNKMPSGMDYATEICSIEGKLCKEWIQSIHQMVA